MNENKILQFASNPDSKSAFSKQEDNDKLSSQGKYFKFSTWKALCYYINPCCKGNSNSDRLFYKGQLTIQQSLDIVHIVREFNNFNRLKYILLDKDQLNLFNLPYRPSLDHELLLKKNSVKLVDFGLEINDKIESKKSYDIIRKRIVESSTTILDYKLVDIVENRHKNNFDKS